MRKEPLVLDFIDSCCYAESGLSVTVKNLWADYKDWCLFSGLKSLSRSKFQAILDREFSLSFSPMRVMGIVPKPESDWEYWDPSSNRFLYLIKASGTPYVKIGISNNPQHRMACLQTGNPYDLELHACYVAGYQAEAYFKNYFAPLRKRGEWFSLGPEQFSYIEELLQDQVIG